MPARPFRFGQPADGDGVESLGRAGRSRIADCEETFTDNDRVDETLGDEDVYEVAVFRSTCDQFGDREVVGVEAPTGRFRAGIDCGDEPVDSAVRENGRLDRDPVDVKPERLMEVRLLTERTVEVV